MRTDAAEGIPTLTYDQTMALGPFRCLSEVTGVTWNVTLGAQCQCKSLTNRTDMTSNDDNPIAHSCRRWRRADH